MISSLFKNSHIIQIPILQATGFLPYSEKSFWQTQSFRQKIGKVIAVVISWSLLFGTGILGALKITELFYKLRSTFLDNKSSNQSSNSLFDSFYYLPDAAISIRCFSLLVIIHVKRHLFHDLFNNISKLIDEYFTDKASKQELSNRIERSSILLLTVTTIIYLAWPLTIWPESFYGSKMGENRTIFSYVDTKPFPIFMNYWQCLCVEIIFRHLAYLLSQQVYLCAIILSMTLSNVLTVMLREIEAETVANKTTEASQVLEKRLSNTEEKLQIWRDAYMSLMTLIDDLNKFFGVVFFLTYSMDFLAVLGSASWQLVSGPNSFYAMYYVTSVAGVLAFGCFATFLPFPLVIVHEKVL